MRTVNKGMLPKQKEWFWMAWLWKDFGGNK